MDRTADFNVYFSGKKLYGDDFGPEDLKKWYDAEAEGYAGIGSKDRGNYNYEYHALNAALFFRYLPSQRFEHVLGFGSAYCEELVPIIDRIGRLTVLEPSVAFPANELRGVPMRYVKPRVDSVMDFPDACFDLIVCASALHHVANVSKVLSEFARCVKPGGYVLIREPTVSMGDWRKPRRGLTACERGIPLNVFRRIIASTGLSVLQENKCVFPLTKRFGRILRSPVYNSRMAVFADGILCRLFAWNRKYHATKGWHKLRPAALAYVLRRLRDGGGRVIEI